MAAARGARLPRRAGRRQLRQPWSPTGCRAGSRSWALARAARDAARQIAAYDNVPVVSWLLLRGRARCCGASISWRYPLTELGLGALYAATVVVLWDDPAEIALGLVFVTMLMAITLTDLELRIIPNRILIVAAGLGLAIVDRDRPGRASRAGDRRGSGGRAALSRGARLPARDGPGRREAGGDDGSLPRQERRAGPFCRPPGRDPRRPRDRSPGRACRPARARSRSGRSLHWAEWWACSQEISSWTGIWAPSRRSVQILRKLITCKAKGLLPFCRLGGHGFTDQAEEGRRSGWPRDRGRQHRRRRGDG